MILIQGSPCNGKQQELATLVSEESDNTSIGFVFSPPQVDDLTITADYWSIEKENTIGLFR